jgi:predicted phage terminase large subunit-like protein
MPGKSVTFIPAKLEDNRILMRKDPNYRANLNALGHVERARLRDGNWKVRREAGSYFKRIWLPIVDELPGIVQAIRYWDRAATEPNAQNPDPDWTAGVKFLECASGPYKYIVEDVARFRLTPGRMRQAIKSTASQDGGTVMQVLEEDPGQAGKSDIDSLVEYLTGFPVDVRRVTKEKGIRAIPLSAACEHGKVALLRGPWNAEYISELVAFDDGAHDDQVDGSSGAYNYLEEQKQPGLRAL